MNINYEFIASAVNYYSRLGYEYIEVPWLVSWDAINITRPPHAQPYQTFSGNLVASGEQSFLEIRNKLEVGKRYQCVTPCFRDENYDDLHKEWFIKNELIWVVNHDLPEYFMMCLEDAKSFFSSYGKVEIVDTDIGKDLFINGIEVGSYGYRGYEKFRWVYGTGVAEPRLSQALNRG